MLLNNILLNEIHINYKAEQVFSSDHTRHSKAQGNVISCIYLIKKNKAYKIIFYLFKGVRKETFITEYACSVLEVQN